MRKGWDVIARIDGGNADVNMGNLEMLRARVNAMNAARKPVIPVMVPRQLELEAVA